MDLSLLIQGTMSVLADPITLVFIVIGVFVGIIFGAVPGLTATLAVIMFLPVTYTMTSVQGLSTLIALYVGGISGGLVAAILLNIPGTPSSIATTFDGAPLAAKGEAGKALGVGVVFSFVGTIFGLIMLVTISPALASVAIQFGAFEYCAVAACALALVISLAGRDLVKGLMGAFFGLMIATAGLSPVDSMKRFTFGMGELTSGFALLTILIGLFAITEVAKAAEDVRKKQDMRVETNVKIKGFGFTLAEFFGQKWNALRSSVIGCIIGILPGIGGAISGMLAYTAAKNQSKCPEKYGYHRRHRRLGECEQRGHRRCAHPAPDARHSGRCGHGDPAWRTHGAQYRAGTADFREERRRDVRTVCGTLYRRTCDAFHRAVRHPYLHPRADRAKTVSPADHHGALCYWCIRQQQPHL